MESRGRVGLTIVSLALGALVCASSIARAQGTGWISGKVVAEETSQPIEGVLIVLGGATRSAVTDAHGAYRLANVPPGIAAVTTSILGRRPDTLRVTVTAGDTAVANFSLKPIPVELANIVVTANREEQNRGEIPGSIGVVDGPTLRAAMPNHPADAMNRIAGVMIRVTNGEGHMTAIRQPITTDPVYLYLEDGIPTRSTGFFNHNALYEVNLPQADRIEVSKGPATALYGSDAIGGVVNVSTRPPSAQPEGSFSLDGGTYSWGRILATGSNTFGGAGVRADLNLTRTGGWRDSTAYDRQSGTLRWDQRIGASARIKTVATYSHIDQQSEGSSISSADFANDPAINYSPFATRQVKAFRYSMAYEQEGVSHSVSVTPYVRYDWMRLIPNWTITYDPSDYTTQNKSLGMLFKYRRDFQPLRTRLILGADGDYSPGSQLEVQAVDTKIAGTPIYTMTYNGTTLYDYDVTYFGISQYAQVEFSPLAPLRITGGVRADESGYDYHTNLPPLATGRWKRPADTSVSYFHVSPKVGATYQFGSAANLFAAYRHGFRVPSQSQLFRQGSAVSTVGLQPVKVNSFEVGVRGLLGANGRVNYDVSVYDMTKLDDILTYVYPDGHSEAQNAGRTTHRGIETSLGVEIVHGLRADVSYSYTKHTYAEWQTTANIDLSGKEMVAAPRSIGFAGLGFGPPEWHGARLGVEMEYLGSFQEDQANTHQYGGYTLWHLRLTSPPFRGFVATLRVMNLTNELYSTLSSWTAAQGEQLAPGQGRRVYLTGQYTLR
jgi:outer membrane receptor protein involved in Fe transport